MVESVSCRQWLTQLQPQGGRSRELPAGGNGQCVVWDIFTLKCSGALSGQGFSLKENLCDPTDQICVGLLSETPGYPWYCGRPSRSVFTVVGEPTYQSPEMLGKIELS